MLRLAFVTDIMTPYTVGVMSELARLADLTVIFATTSSVRGGGWQFEELSFPHVIVGGVAVQRSNPLISDYYFDPRIFTELRRVRPAVVIGAGWSFPTWYAAAYARLARCALVIHSDGTPLTEARLSRLQRLSRRLLIPIANGFAANSGPARQRFIELGAAPEKVHLAPHSTSLGPFWAVGASRADQPHRGPLRVLMAGRLLRHKGFVEGIRAVAKARTLGAGLHLTIAGAGPDDELLRDLARRLEQPVEFLGFVDQPDLARAFARAEVFLFPTLRDEFGFVLLEAQAAGLACIASPFAGATADLIVDGENGLVADPADAGQLVSVLASLAHDRELVRRLGSSAHVSSLERTPRRTAEGYLAAAHAALR